MISFEFCMMVEATELCILVSVLMTLTPVSLDEMYYAATTCWFVGVYAKFILHN